MEFDNLPAEIVDIIITLSQTPFKFLTLSRWLFEISRKVIIRSLLSVEKTQIPDKGNYSFCPKSNKFSDLLKNMTVKTSVWYAANLIGLSFSCIIRPLPFEVERFIDRLTQNPEDFYMSIYVGNFDKTPFRDNVLLMKILTREKRTLNVAAKVYRIYEHVLSNPLVPNSSKKRCIKTMVENEEHFPIHWSCELRYRCLSMDLIERILKHPNSKFDFCLHTNFNGEHANMVKHLYTKGKLSAQLIRDRTINEKRTIVTPYCNDKEYLRDLDDDPYYKVVIANVEVHQFIKWVEQLPK